MTAADGRPPFDEIYMHLAWEMSRRSTCQRVSSTGARYPVGCAIVSTDYRQVLSIGYNGNASGLPNACDDPTAAGGCLCVHAEANAVIACREPRGTPKIVFATTLPCVMCSKYIIQLGGVVEVVWETDYRVRRSLELFDAVGIRHRQLVTRVSSTA